MIKRLCKFRFETRPEHELTELVGEFVDLHLLGLGSCALDRDKLREQTMIWRASRRQFPVHDHPSEHRCHSAFEHAQCGL